MEMGDGFPLFWAIRLFSQQQIAIFWILRNGVPVFLGSQNNLDWTGLWEITGLARLYHSVLSCNTKIQFLNFSHVWMRNYVLFLVRKTLLMCFHFYFFLTKLLILPCGIMIKPITWNSAKRSSSPYPQEGAPWPVQFQFNWQELAISCGPAEGESWMCWLFSPLVTACSVTNPRYIYLQSPTEILYSDKTILSRM